MGGGAARGKWRWCYQTNGEWGLDKKNKSGSLLALTGHGSSPLIGQKLRKGKCGHTESNIGLTDGASGSKFGANVRSHQSLVSDPFTSNEPSRNNSRPCHAWRSCITTDFLQQPLDPGPKIRPYQGFSKLL